MTTGGKTVAIIGGGPAGLIAAEKLSAEGFTVTVYERKPSLARKFLMAGRGGLNITHSENIESFATRYRGGCGDPVQKAIHDFTPDFLRAWCEGLGQETFVGSSGRVFPKSLKASPLLRAWIARLSAQGVQFRMQSTWAGWTDEDALRFIVQDGREDTVRADAVILAMGGASWPSLGSDGSWANILSGKGVTVNPFLPANCGFHVAWSDIFREKFSGQPLKGIALECNGQRALGEMMIDHKGVEGGAVYALSSHIRDSVMRGGPAHLRIDLRPNMSVQDITGKLSHVSRGRKSFSTYLQKALSLNPVSISLLREADKQIAEKDVGSLANLIKSIPLTLTRPFDIDRAISSAGGIAASELNNALMLKKIPGVFCAGEMLDWEAPTGGYLLQACFATGAAAAQGVKDYFRRA
ncbi:MAG: aminoacetone oxidase family FAD-binding enzyme [Micavibrio aeruginosavorus]|uniref:Aminoacetone oxidase family FAD-binding enzyme n=1 Tax=Micavibrio aeruginosavorus TaxID=349221 RepID=A0A2W4ZIS3_9BACT|nr:MAG: aminoacetone oxidase family FAD-binding enzyme [Micavibrio aeruginosavorus]